jgi:hypothetical protein
MSREMQRDQRNSTGRFSRSLARRLISSKGFAFVAAQPFGITGTGGDGLEPFLGAADGDAPAFGIEPVEIVGNDGQVIEIGKPVAGSVMVSIRIG